MTLEALLACHAPPPELTVLAASSLGDVLPEVAGAWEARGGSPVTVSVDASSRLARQVEAGVAADVALLADGETMDALDAAGLLAAGTRRDLLGNALVVVVPTEADWTPRGLEDLVRADHLALAGPQVPAGRYARQALGERVRDLRVVEGDSVRAALAWVARGEADAGVVFATDARAEPAVRLAFAFPPGAHEPIVYPGAVLAASDQAGEAAAFLAFLESPEARAVFREAGFAPPP